jgi:neutral ceramidase
MHSPHLTTALAVGLLGIAAVSSGCTSPTQIDSSSATLPLSIATQCIADSPELAYGAASQSHAVSSVPEAASTGAMQSVPACSGNTHFVFGAGKADITGPAGGKIHMGNEDPMNYSVGIHIRQYARSFAIESPCNGKRILMVLTDTGMLFESVKKAVLDKVAADPDLASLYSASNVMMSATHTHSTPGGQAHFTAYNALRGGHDRLAFESTVNGTFKSIQRAHQAFLDNQQGGQILLDQGELLGANTSRAVPAYMENPAAERARYLDVAGNDLTTPRLMTLLKLQTQAGRQLGSLNWFAVHPTSDALSEYGLGAAPISGDNKGYASFMFERLQQQENGLPFVASFMQADEGDAFTQMYFDNPAMKAENDKLLPTTEPSPVTVANGKLQLQRALSLYQSASNAVSGPIDFRFGYVQMDQVEVTDPVVLDTLEHRQALDAIPKRTCNPSMGVSFPAAGHGAQPGEPGQFTEAGISCSDPDYAQLAADEFRAGAGANIPTGLFAATVGCNASSAPGLNLECQAEKPILFVFGPPLNASATTVPFQLFRIGNLVTVGLPWEVTTMAGRRIRSTLLETMKGDGVDYVVITGLANDYVSYLTTREEYALQMYEAASNQFGPWSLAAVQQETRRLALDMVNARETEAGPTPPTTSPQAVQTLPPQGSDQAPAGSTFGAVVSDADPSYNPGDAVKVVFQASSPNSDLKSDGSFVFVEQLSQGETWNVISYDADPETSFIWHSDAEEPQFNASTTSTAEVVWRIPKNTAQGSYRIRFEGVANQASVLTPYKGVSRQFTLGEPSSICP